LRCAASKTPVLWAERPLDMISDNRFAFSTKRRIAVLSALAIGFLLLAIVGRQQTETPSPKPVSTFESLAREQPDRQLSSKGTDWKAFQDCTYYSTRNQPSADPFAVGGTGAAPPQLAQPARVDDSAMLNAHESLKVHDKRQLLAGAQHTPPLSAGIASYDLTGDCRNQGNAHSVTTLGP
jgi:hypothetical protein